MRAVIGFHFKATHAADRTKRHFRLVNFALGRLQHRAKGIIDQARAVLDFVVHHRPVRRLANHGWIHPGDEGVFVTIGTDRLVSGLSLGLFRRLIGQAQCEPDGAT